MAVSDPLEEYAQGQGGGAYSPQQGSGLPIAPVRTGGLPLGQAPSAIAAPQPQPTPMPPFRGLPPVAQPQGQTPLLSLGGQPAPLEQMIQQALGQVQGYGQMSPWQKFTGGTQGYGQAMSILPELQKLAATKSQDRQLQATYLKQMSDGLKEYAGLTPEQQTAQGPIYGRLLAAHGQLAGMQLAPEDIQHTLSSPDLARTYASVLDDPLIPKDQAVARLGSVKPGKEREDALGQIQTEAAGHALAMVQQYLPQAVASFGGSTAKPLAMDDFLKKLGTDPQLGQVVQSSRSVQTALQSFLSDPKNADTLAGYGLKPGAVNMAFLTAQAKAQAEGPSLGQPIKDVLAEMPHPATGQPLTPATASLLPNGPQLIAQARDIANARDIKTAAAKSYADAQAIAASKGDTPMAILFPDKHLVDPNTGQPVSPTLTFNQGVQQIKQGANKQPVVMDAKQYTNYQEMTSLMRDMGKLVDVTSRLKGAGPAQALGAWFASVGGNADDTQAAMMAYQSLIIRYQKAMTGTGRYVQTEAMKMAGGFPSFYDSSQSGLNRLRATADMLQGQLDASLGKIDFGDLQKKVTDAQARIDREQATTVPKGYGVVDYPDGTSGAKPLGSKLMSGAKWRTP